MNSNSKGGENMLDTEERLNTLEGKITRIEQSIKKMEKALTLNYNYSFNNLEDNIPILTKYDKDMINGDWIMTKLTQFDEIVKKTKDVLKIDD